MIYNKTQLEVRGRARREAARRRNSEWKVNLGIRNSSRNNGTFHSAAPFNFIHLLLAVLSGQFTFINLLHKHFVDEITSGLVHVSQPKQMYHQRGVAAVTIQRASPIARSRPTRVASLCMVALIEFN